MQKRTFQIYRYDPDKDAKPYMQTVSVELDGHERMLLDALLKLKAQDPSLSFRRSCREGVCGSDAMNINGKNGLACLTNMNTLPGTVDLKPLPGLPVIRDLIVDMTQFFKQYHSIKPYLQSDIYAAEDKERLQSPEEREELNGLYECILCASCSTACPSFWWNPDKFVGPAGLLQAYRFIADSRDQATGERLEYGNVVVSSGLRYDPGTRRVRQVPEYGFDQPMAGTGGKMTIDQDRLFNGAPLRYDWKSLGKKEIYVPANTYRLHGNDVKYADLLKPGHANPDFMRYELRRVWVLEATLKEGFRHVFGKRVLFLDEDTGQALMSDYYDARGQLWQHGVMNHYYAYDANTFHAGTSFFYDLNSGGYVAYNMTQERPQASVLNKGDQTPAMFTPEAARNAGN